MENQKQESLVDFSTGMTLALTVVFSVSRSVQIWSRVPGSTGSWFYGWMFVVGLGINVWYYQANVQACQARDFIGLAYVAEASIAWFGVHGIVRLFNNRGTVPSHSYEPGVGILFWLMPALSASTVAIVSDLCVALLLGCVLSLLGSPIQAGWYFAMCFWLSLGHLWIKSRDARNCRVWRDTQYEAEYMSQKINRR